MRDQANQVADDAPPRTATARILPFRPRTSAALPDSTLEQQSAPADDGASDDFKHRMLVNAAGLVCAALLTVSGIWLASRISELRQTQDCVLSGRRDCAPVGTVDKPSAPLRQH